MTGIAFQEKKGKEELFNFFSPNLLLRFDFPNFNVSAKEEGSHSLSLS